MGNEYDLESETLLVCSARQDGRGNTNALNELIAGEELKRKTEREKDEATSEKEESSLGAHPAGKAVNGAVGIKERPRQTAAGAAFYAGAGRTTERRFIILPHISCTSGPSHRNQSEYHGPKITRSQMPRQVNRTKKKKNQNQKAKTKTP